jgi:hypothetical protein
MTLKKLERHLQVNMLGPAPRLVKKRTYRAAVSQRLRNTVVERKLWKLDSDCKLERRSETGRGTDSFSTLLLGTAKEALILTTG